MSEFNRQKAIILEKVRESIFSVLPILCIVCLLCLFVTPLPTGHMLSFLVGSLFVVAGMGLFTVGAESSMTPIGSRVGSALTKSKKLWLILLVSFLLGRRSPSPSRICRCWPPPCPTSTRWCCFWW